MSTHALPSISVEDTRSRSCPYLDTIDRNMLDFDFEKLCSISLSNNNVYACLVCGKYFQGRGQHSLAYLHSLEQAHHVFINLHTLRFYCLPDNYEIVDSSLNDIKYVVNPTYDNQSIKDLDSNSKLRRSFNGVNYYAGLIGLNNIKSNDYCNVIFQALAHVKPIRDFFLILDNYKDLSERAISSNILLVIRFGELIRKLWNPRHFKPHVSPHEMLQSIVECSQKNFKITEQGDPQRNNDIDHHRHRQNRSYHQLANNRDEKSEYCFFVCSVKLRHEQSNDDRYHLDKVIRDTFEGQVRIFSRKLVSNECNEISSNPVCINEYQEDKPFLCLSIDLPTPPLFQDERKESIIPQVPLIQILSKFDGTSEHEVRTYKESFMKRYQLLKLPKYLILSYQRFTRNNFYLEKNNTIVNFPIKDVDFGHLLATDEAATNKTKFHYDLIANIVHDGDPESKKGSYRVHILHRSADTWYEIQDLHVNAILPQMITLSEAYLQIWERI